jgi:hypothetical protein
MRTTDGTFVTKQGEKLPAGDYNVCVLAIKREDGEKREDIDFTVPNQWSARFRND